MSESEPTPRDRAAHPDTPSRVGGDHIPRGDTDDAVGPTESLRRVRGDTEDGPDDPESGRTTAAEAGTEDSNTDKARTGSHMAGVGKGEEREAKHGMEAGHEKLEEGGAGRPAGTSTGRMQGAVTEPDPVTDTPASGQPADG